MVVLGDRPTSRPPSYKQSGSTYGRSIDAGKVEAIVDRELPMSQAPQAHRVMAAGEHVGNILLLPT